MAHELWFICDPQQVFNKFLLFPLGSKALLLLFPHTPQILSFRMGVFRVITSFPHPPPMQNLLSPNFPPLSVAPASNFF